MFQHPRIPVALSLVSILALSSPGMTGEIHRLIKEGEIRKAKDLLIKDQNLIEARDDLDQTPLHVAAYYGHVTMVKFLIDQDAEINARAYNQFTPLHLAIEFPEIVEVLIGHKAEVDAKDYSDRTPLQHAAEKWANCMKHGDHFDRKTAKLLLDAGANYDMLSAIWLADSNRVCAMLKNNPKEALGEGVLATAAAYGRTAIVKLLLDHKADPKDRGLGWPALYFALEFPEVVQLLLKAGADAKFRIEFTDLFNKGIGPEQTLLHCAAELGQVDTGKLLLEAGVSVDSHDAYHKTPLQWAARAGKPEMVKFFLQNKASVAGKVGRQAMAEAAQFVGNAKTQEDREKQAGHRAVIDILLAHSVPMDLFTAIGLDKVDRVKELLNEKPELARSADPEGQRGNLPLHLAVICDCKQIVTLLLDAKAPINAINERGNTPLHEAAFWERNEIAKLLIERKADVNAKDTDGGTPMHQTARYGTLEMVRLLLDAGAEINARDNEGRTPLSRAKTREMIKLLSQHGGTK